MALVNLPASNVMAIFSQIGQVTKKSERPNHAHGLRAFEALEQTLERQVGLLIGIAPISHRQAAHLLHQLIRCLTLLGPNHVAK